MTPDAPQPGETGQPAPQVRGKPGEIDDKLFESVDFGSTQSYACSPPEPEDPAWQGILIRAPKRIAFKPGETVGQRKAFARIPICGFFMFAASPGPAPTDQPMKLVVSDQRTKKTYAGMIVEEDPGHPEPAPEPPSVDPKDLEGLLSGGYFNVNLADYVRLPAEPGRYDVRVECGPHRSNTVSVEVAREEGPAKPKTS